MSKRPNYPTKQKNEPCVFYFGQSNVEQGIYGRCFSRDNTQSNYCCLNKVERKSCKYYKVTL